MGAAAGLSNTSLSSSTTSASSDAGLTPAATLLSSDLANAIRQLAETLSSTIVELGDVTWSQAALAIFVVFVGALSAYLFNLLHWRMIDKRQKMSGSFLALNALVTDLDSVAVNYWLKDFDPKERVNMQEAEITIKNNIHLIANYIRLLTPLLGNSLSESKKKIFDDFPLVIFDLATGDGFESMSKISSKPKAMKISKLCVEIKTIVLSMNVSA